MKERIIIKIGPKGELLIPEDVYEKMGIKIGQKIILKFYRNRLIVQKYEPLEEILKQPSVKEISYKEFENIRNDFD